MVEKIRFHFPTPSVHIAPDLTADVLNTADSGRKLREP